MTGRDHPPAGYANPPARHRFREGNSGNPRGRPRKKDDPWSALSRVLNRKVKIAGSDERMPVREALIRKLRELALAGDRRALSLHRQILEAASSEGPKQVDMEAERRRIEDTVRRIKAAVYGEAGTDG